MNERDDEKKANERKVLKEALKLAQMKGGESRRNVARIRGSLEFQEEAPDFIFLLDRPEKSSAVGLAVEHFRVDHFSEPFRRKEGQRSLASKAENQAKAAIKEMGVPSLEDGVPPAMLDKMGRSFADCLEAKQKSFFGNYIKSLKCSFGVHLGKVEGYRKSVSSRLSGIGNTKVAFLIELHSDFSDLILNDRGVKRRLTSGEPVIFREMIDVFKRGAGNVDYLILAFYPALSGNIVDAFVVRPSMLEKSLERVKVPICEYLGEDRHAPVCRESSIGFEAIEKGGEIAYELNRDNDEISSVEQVNWCLRALPELVSAQESGRAFATTRIMQLFLELYGGMARGGRRVTPMQFERYFNSLDKDELKEKSDAFFNRWYDAPDDSVEITEA